MIRGCAPNRAKRLRPKHSSRSSSTASTIRHGPFRSRWLYGFESSLQREADCGAQPLALRLPTSYGHTNPAYVGRHSDYRGSDERGDSFESTEPFWQHQRRQVRQDARCVVTMNLRLRPLSTRFFRHMYRWEMKLMVNGEPVGYCG